MSYHGLGQSTTLTNTTNASVASIQCALRARGVSIAQDGRFGPNTRSALQAQQTSFLPSVVGLLFEDARTGATTVAINRTFYEWLLSPRQSCRSASAEAPSAPPSSPGSQVEEPVEEPTPESPAAWKTWVPIGGAAALLGLGIYFVSKNKRS